MAGKIQEVAFEAEKTYSRTDYTALRAYLNKLSVETILHLYYDVDELAEQGIEGTRGLRQFLEAMRDDLIKKTIERDILGRVPTSIEMIWCRIVEKLIR